MARRRSYYKLHLSAPHYLMDVPPHFVKRLNDLWHIHGDVAAEAKVLLQAWRCVGLMLEHKVAYSRPMVACLVRYGPVRQKKTFLHVGRVTGSGQQNGVRHKSVARGLQKGRLV